MNASSLYVEESLLANRLRTRHCGRPLLALATATATGSVRFRFLSRHLRARRVRASPAGGRRLGRLPLLFPGRGGRDAHGLGVEKHDAPASRLFLFPFFFLLRRRRRNLRLRLGLAIRPSQHLRRDRPSRLRVASFVIVFVWSFALSRSSPFCDLCCRFRRRFQVFLRAS